MAMAPGHLLLLLLLLLISPTPSPADISSGTPDGTEAWGYIDVRPGEHISHHVTSFRSTILAFFL
jgi:hypothetical protein